MKFLNKFSRYSKMSKIEADKESTTYNFLSSALTLIFVPIFGYFSDKYCWHSNFGVIAPIITQISFFLYMSLRPLWPTIVFAVGYSMNYTAVWSNISLCVDNHQMVLILIIFFLCFYFKYINFFLKKIINFIFLTNIIEEFNFAAILYSLIFIDFFSILLNLNTFSRELLWA